LLNLQQKAEYQTKTKMGFRKLITSKKLYSLFAALTLFAGAAMAQSSDAGSVAQSTQSVGSPDSMANSAMWTGVLYYVLMFLVVAICLAVVGRILTVYDLTQKMQGKKGTNWNNVMGIVCLVFIIAGMYGAFWSITEQGSVKLPVAASAHGGAIDDMFTVTTILTLIVFVITQILLFGFAFVYRATGKRKGYFLPHNNTIEKLWTVIPAIVLTVLVVFGFFTWQSVMNSDEQKGDLNIDITGHQFKWELRYPGPDGKLGAVNYTLSNPNNVLGIDFTDRYSLDDLSADTLVLPVGHPVRLNIHAQDVIHSVFMPHFRVQLNAVPGLPTFFRFTPTITTAQMRVETDDPNFEYLVYCNKICGGAHYNMQKVVRVVSEAEYQDWISHQKPYLTPALKQQLKMAAAKTKSAGQTNSLALNN
jgi:cytochrome c oxidase subunit 2